MIKTVGIVSLSSGIIGESFVRHEVEIGIRRLRNLGLTVRFMPHALKGLDYVRDHPEKRAEDLLEAFRDPEIDMILCAIGGDDTYRMLPYLFEHGELREAVRQKVFLGFSDSTINHLMLDRVGLPTFYGQSFLADVCEIGPDMFSYSRGYFEELIKIGKIREIRPSNVWYEERKSFEPSQIGTMPTEHADHGFERIQGPASFSGRILGGCIDSLYDCFDAERYADMPELIRKYSIFPAREDWQGRILLLETSEEKMPPDKYRKALMYLRDAGVFEAVSGVLVGKPMDEQYAREYRELLVEGIDRPALPVVMNVNVGHAQPRCIIPIGVWAYVNADEQVIRFTE
ncbi:MAG: LD-carboxypeptidase [Clostridia bacterium]|nr:LD-carboxypeptidase [Clostridia bacterium]